MDHYFNSSRLRSRSERIIIPKRQKITRRTKSESQYDNKIYKNIKRCKSLEGDNELSREQIGNVLSKRDLNSNKTDPKLERRKSRTITLKRRSSQNIRIIKR